jgi:hypothetical protein
LLSGGRARRGGGGGEEGCVTGDGGNSGGEWVRAVLIRRPSHVIGKGLTESGVFLSVDAKEIHRETDSDG